MDPSSAQGTPLTYDELIVAAEHVNDYQYNEVLLLREYEEEQAQFEIYCQDMWRWFQNYVPSWAPFN